MSIYVIDKRHWRSRIIVLLCDWQSFVQLLYLPSGFEFIAERDCVLLMITLCRDCPELWKVNSIVYHCARILYVLYLQMSTKQLGPKYLQLNWSFINRASMHIDNSHWSHLDPFRILSLVCRGVKWIISIVLLCLDDLSQFSMFTMNTVLNLNIVNYWIL